MKLTAEDFPVDLPDHGDRAVYQGWLDEQLARVGDRAFGEWFHQAVPVAGTSPAEYQHRILEVEGGRALCGIRFKGGDPEAPFVDLLAWTGGPRPSWVRAIAAAYRLFAPRWVRYPLTVGADRPWAAHRDQGIHVGRSRGQDDPRVRTMRDLGWYEDFRHAFETWREGSPIGTDVHAAERADLEECVESGAVVVAARKGEIIGLAACRPGALRSFSGWEMVEEFVMPDHRGHGWGVILQRALMAQLPPESLVWGTIDARNAASIKTAQRCGRIATEAWWFAPCHDSADAAG